MDTSATDKLETSKLAVGQFLIEAIGFPLFARALASEYPEAHKLIPRPNEPKDKGTLTPLALWFHENESRIKWIDGVIAECVMIGQIGQMRRIGLTKDNRPLTMENVGPNIWRNLHLAALQWTGEVQSQASFLVKVGRSIPCGECRSFWATRLRENPPPKTNAEDFFRWTWETHNSVNRKLGKPEMPFDEALALYQAPAES